MFYGSGCDESSGRSVANNPNFEEMTNPRSLNPRLTDSRVLSELKDKRLQCCRVYRNDEHLVGSRVYQSQWSLREGRVKISSAA